MRISRGAVALMIIMPVALMAEAWPEEDLSIDIEEEIEVVISPTRLKQHLSEVPASVTVVSAEKIYQLGLTTVPDVLRLVPGMMVGSLSGWEHRVSYHGTNGIVPRRMQVLVDGMSVYRTGYSLVDWHVLPVAIEDIARIEVTRSPSAATYGANSFFAVINIITKHPGDTDTFRFVSQGGALGAKNGFLSYSGEVGSKLAYRVSYKHMQNTGFDSDGDQNRRDSLKNNQAYARITSNLSDQSTLDASFGAIWGAHERQFADRQQISNPDFKTEDLFASATWTYQLANNNELKIKGNALQFNRDRDWRSCYPAALFTEEVIALDAINTDAINVFLQGGMPTGKTAAEQAAIVAVAQKLAAMGSGALTTICGDVNEDSVETQYDLELQDTHVFNSQLRMVTGFGLRRDVARSETYFSGKGSITKDTQRLFGTVEFKATPDFIVNFGSMFEYEEHSVNDWLVSPRLAINYHIIPNHTVRLIWSKGVRTPDSVEQNRNWRYFARKLDPLFEGKAETYFYHTTTADVLLSPEKIASHEISYYAQIPDHSLAWDVKIYREELTDLISEKLQFFDYNPTNSNYATLTGAELEISYKPWSSVSLYLNYAYIHNKSSNVLERSLHANHSGSVSAAYDFNPTWSVSAAYFGNSTMGGSVYDRFDFSLVNKRYFSRTNMLNLRGTVRHFGSKQSTYVKDSAALQHNIYKDDTHLTFTVEYRM